MFALAALWNPALVQGPSNTTIVIDTSATLCYAADIIYSREFDILRPNHLMEQRFWVLRDIPPELRLPVHLICTAR